jgi:hypothetical protein
MLRVQTIDLRKPMTLVAPILTGIAAKIATEKIPDMMKLTGNQRLLGQLGVGMGGAFLMGNLVGAVGATVWISVSLAEVFSGYVNRMIAQIQVPATVSGSEIPYPLGAYPNELGAFPSDVTYPM